jgi:exonuclease VII small subunit
MSDKSGTYDKNFAILEKITESLNKDEIGIDDLVSRTKEALDAARSCMEILKKQRGEFKKLEKEFSRLMENSDEESEHPLNEDDRLVEPD